MSDLRLVWTSPYSSDLVVSANDIAIDDGLRTAIMLSLFTDRRAADTDTLPSNSSDRRGWWGDTFPDVPNYLMGSRLWLLSRSKQTPEVLINAKAYVVEALQWLLEDGVAAAVTVVTEFTKPGLLGIQVRIDQPDATSVKFQFGYAWAAEAAEVA